LNDNLIQLANNRVNQYNKKQQEILNLIEDHKTINPDNPDYKLLQTIKA